MQIRNIENKEETLKYGADMPAELMLKLREDAKADDRSVASLVGRILKEYFKNELKERI
jgi:hypothetical protein